MVKRASVSMWLALLIACNAQERNDSSAADRLSAAHGSVVSGSYRAMVYSAAFAEKYSLPSGGVQKLDPGLQALVLRIVQRPADHPVCYLDFYVDDTLDLAFPEGSEGVLARPDDENPYFFVRDAALMTAQDHRWDARTGSFRQVACRKDPKNCLVQESGPSAYARHLMPGLALQTFSLMCSALDPKYAPTEMWMLRDGRDPRELIPSAAEESAAYRFAMPGALFEHAAIRIRQAIKFYEDTPLGPEHHDFGFAVPGVQ